MIFGISDLGMENFRLTLILLGIFLIIFMLVYVKLSSKNT